MRAPGTPNRSCTHPYGCTGGEITAPATTFGSSGSVKVSRNSRSNSVDQIIVLLGGEAGRSLVAHRIA